MTALLRFKLVSSDSVPSYLPFVQTWWTQPLLPWSQDLLSKSRELKTMTSTAQKMKFSIKDFFSKCDQIRSFLRLDVFWFRFQIIKIYKKIIIYEYLELIFYITGSSINWRISSYKLFTRILNITGGKLK